MSHLFALNCKIWTRMCYASATVRLAIVLTLVTVPLIVESACGKLSECQFSDVLL